jgi:hypothetical protein
MLNYPTDNSALSELNKDFIQEKIKVLMNGICIAEELHKNNPEIKDKIIKRFQDEILEYKKLLIPLPRF